MLTGKNLQDALDEAIRKGINEAQVLFHKQDGKRSYIHPDTFNKIKATIRAEREKVRMKKDLVELADFNSKIRNVFDIFDLGNEKATRNLKEIMKKVRKKFLATVMKGEPEVTETAQQSPGEEGHNDAMSEKAENEIALDEQTYETVLTNEVQQWFEDFFEQLFAETSPLFLSKEGCADQAKFISTTTDGSIKEMVSLLQEYFPFEKPEEGKTQEEKDECSANIRESLNLLLKEILTQLKYPAEEIANIVPPALTFFEERIKYDRIVAVREAKKMGKNEYEGIETDAYFFCNVVEDNLPNILMGKARLEYTLQKEKPDAFQAKPESLLYPIEEMIIEKFIKDIITGKPLETKAEAEIYFNNSTGKNIVADILDQLNRKIHGGLEIRGAIADHKEVMKVIQKILNERFKDEEIPNPRQEVKNAHANRESEPESKNTQNKKECPPKTSFTEVEAATGPQKSAQAEMTRESKIVSEIDTKNLPKENLSPEDKPEHIPTPVFERINSILEWARDFDGVGTRKIDRLIVAKTIILTTHLRALTVRDALVFLVELEGLREIMERPKLPGFDEWVRICLKSIEHLDPEEEQEEERTLTARMASVFKKSQAKIVTIEQETTALETTRNPDLEQELKHELERKNQLLETLKKDLEEIEKEGSEQRILLSQQIKMDSPEFKSIVKRLAEIIESHEDRTRRLDLCYREIESINQDLEAMNRLHQEIGEKRAALERLKEVRADIIKKIEEALNTLNILAEQT